MKCSIIVANFNNGKYLADLIQSVLKQTEENWELVITDDCSTDNSIEILRPFLSDHRIKLIIHEQNKGAARSFKTSLENSNGEIIIMLGADDALRENAVKEVLYFHEKYPEASMIMGQKVICDDLLKPTEELMGFPIIKDSDTYLNYFGLTGFDTFKREKYNQSVGFDISQTRALDQALYYAMEETGKIYSVPMGLYLYRHNTNGISQDSNKSFAHEYNYKAIIKAYERRQVNGFKNITAKKYKEIQKKYHQIKFINYLKAFRHLNISVKDKEIILNITNNFKLRTLDEIYTLFQLIGKFKGNIHDLNDYFAKQAFLESYFIKKHYTPCKIFEVFNKDIKPYKYLSLRKIIIITIKNLIGWKAK